MKIEKFAKLFEEDDEQILVVLDEGEEGPEIKYHFKPEGLGICCATIVLEDSETAYDRAREFFDKIDHAHAIAKLKSIKKEFSDAFSKAIQGGLV